VPQTAAMRTPSLTVSALAATAVLALGALSACGGESVTDRLTEKAIENSGGEGVDVDVDSDNGEVRIETDEGTFSSGNELPANFPDDIPLLDAEILSAVASDNASGTGDLGFVIAMQTDLSDADAVAQATELLTDAGFVPDETSSASEDMFGASVLNREPYQVLVTAIAGDPTLVQYYVGPIPE